MSGVTHLRGHTSVHNTMLQEAPLMPVQKRSSIYAWLRGFDPQIK